MMEPFNIKISPKRQIVTLTILPEALYFKIIYYGAIVGAVKKVANDWVAIPTDDIEPGDLPLYEYKQSNIAEQPNFELSLRLIRQIGKEIEYEVS